jgi:hypothetical protein
MVDAHDQNINLACRYLRLRKPRERSERSRSLNLVAGQEVVACSNDEGESPVSSGEEKDEKQYYRPNAPAPRTIS